ncbi:hypothetical protein K4A83_13425 [Spirulina subsalsa FACHB-351]|uniref:Uncharacterized protein n=1 Tax=Spirulina subsalsa FACHB-351 TaxID=234711 RepID=A0ABT3L6Y3_9CYAN|nr:hypothetical protein [Spirulina subsalsa]MCW6037263.1 hypothetical protein [Spirulina subsalsa FACHB-351]
MTYTTEQLIEILEQELRASWKGERVLLSAEERFNDPVLAPLLGSHKIGKVYAYREFREQVHQYQKDHQVSGLVWRTCRFKGQTVRYPELHNQLIALEQDKEILLQSKASVLEFWQQTTPGLKFWFAGHDPQAITPELVEQLAQDAEWAEVDATLTELYLGLCWGNPQECHYQWAMPESGCRRIVAAPNRPSLIKV